MQTNLRGSSEAHDCLLIQTLLWNDCQDWWIKRKVAIDTWTLGRAWWMSDILSERRSGKQCKIVIRIRCKTCMGSWCCQPLWSNDTLLWIYGLGSI